jgi:hypothetical protein
MVGDSPTLLGVAATIYAVGRLKDDPKVSHAGMDLLHSIAVTEGVTQALKYTTRRNDLTAAVGTHFHQDMRRIRSPLRWRLNAI